MEKARGVKFLLEARLNGKGTNAGLWALGWSHGKDFPWAFVDSITKDKDLHLRTAEDLAEAWNRYRHLVGLLRQAAIQLANPTFPCWIYQQSLAQSIECYLNSIGEGALIPDDDMKE